MDIFVVVRNSFVVYKHKQNNSLLTTTCALLHVASWPANHHPAVFGDAKPGSTEMTTSYMLSNVFQGTMNDRHLQAPADAVLS